MKIFKVGDLIRIRCEWRGGNETDILYRVVSVNEATERCYIEPEFSSLPLKPQELVGFEMIKKRVMISRLRKALQQLEPEESMIIDLLYYKGMSQRGAAEKIGIASTTLQYKLKVLMIKLKDIVNDGV